VVPRTTDGPLEAREWLEHSPNQRAENRAAPPLTKLTQERSELSTRMTRDARLPSTSCRRGVVAPVVLMLFDPLAVPDALLMLAPEREPVIALTAPWHERDAQTLVERLDAALFAPSPDTAQDLVDKSGITAEQAGDGSRTCNGLAATPGRPGGTRAATASRSGSRHIRAASATTSSCGSTVSAQSLRVIRLSTSGRGGAVNSRWPLR
jgi:hypothetical protein